MVRFVVYSIIIAVFLCLGGGPARAANMNVSAITLGTAASGVRNIGFNVSWTKSWRDGTNWDAAWVFAKYSVYSAGAWGVWTHCKLSATSSDHTAPTGVTIDSGLYDGSGPAWAPGVFLYRNANGTGDNTWTNAAVKWNYGLNGVADGAQVRVKVFAIEMVHIPTGAFKIGDGNGASESTNAFHVTDNTGNITIGTTLAQHIKVDVNSYDDDVIESANGNTGIGIQGSAGLDVDDNGVIDNASFPTGYNAFYLMKYELTQGQYRDFLNTLTRVQQAHRQSTNSTTIGNGLYVMSGAASGQDITTCDNTTTVNYLCRNAIRAPLSVPASPTVVTFGVDYNMNGVFNEASDGEWIAANWLSWADQCAYADWSGLRPFTELEFEKAARGPADAVYQDQACGSATTRLSLYAITAGTSGYTNETLDAVSATPTCNAQVSDTNTISANHFIGPLRTGIFAYKAATKDRKETGGSFYGVMELSGNLWERPVTVGVSQGRSFLGTHGDGLLTTTASYEGNATNTDWPGIDATPARGVTGSTTPYGSGSRGGSWNGSYTYARVSDRYYAAYANSSRSYNYGARCARTSP
jgi:formylglycine-generating enzyme required for sulfatase activity